MRNLLRNIILSILFFWSLDSFAQYTLSINASPDQHVFASNSFPIVIGDTITNHYTLDYLSHGSGQTNLTKYQFNYLPKYVIVEEKGKEVQVLNTEYHFSKNRQKRKVSFTAPEGKTIKKRKHNDINMVLDDVKVNINGNYIEQRLDNWYGQTRNELNETETGLAYVFGGIVNSMLTSLGHNKNDKVEHQLYQNILKYNADISIYEKVSYYGYLNYETTITYKLLDSYGTEIHEEIKKINPGSIEELIYQYNEHLIDLIASDSIVSVKNKLIKRIDSNHKKMDTISIDFSKSTSNTTTVESAIEKVVTVVSNFGHGSGCLISPDGYILTNHHVINNVDSLVVVTSDGDTISCDLVRSDPVHDIALIKADTTFTNYFELHKNIAFQKVNEDIYIIGTPANHLLNNSLSKGYIAGYRPEINDGIYQIGVSVNPGNSGGALINKDGDLIGIVNAKMIGYGVKKIGYAIPIQHIHESLNINVTN